MKYKHRLLCLIMLGISISTIGQNVSSPYSIIGIGDIETTDNGRFGASGSTGVSRREIGFYNFANPASLTVIPYKSVNYDILIRGRNSKFKAPETDTFTSTSKDFVVKRIALSFKVTPKIAFSFGLKPFSSVNYQYTGSSSANDQNIDYTRYIDGSGGINQVYFSIAREISKGLSAGLTASWLFGSLKRSTAYSNEALGLDVVKKEYDFYAGAGLQGGIQYYPASAGNWQQSVGLTATVYNSLKGERTTDYLENNTAVKSLEPEKIQFRMPVSVVGGYRIANKNGLGFQVQGSYHQWPKQQLNLNNATISNAFGLSTGIEYSKRTMISGYALEQYYLACGFRFEQSYIRLNNNSLNEYAFTLGGGKNVSPVISINAGIEIGRRGQVSFKQISENYFQYSIGITLKDIWYGTRNFRKYD
ncbi:MAG TPA: hypothetical protein VJ552_03545 [Sediminibacterium sp.]|nr:hypothetical protein [Sediminibacterium sp.]